MSNIDHAYANSTTNMVSFDWPEKGQQANAYYFIFSGLTLKDIRILEENDGDPFQNYG